MTGPCSPSSLGDPPALCLVINTEDLPYTAHPMSGPMGGQILFWAPKLVITETNFNPLLQPSFCPSGVKDPMDFISAGLMPVLFAHLIRQGEQDHILTLLQS